MNNNPLTNQLDRIYEEESARLEAQWRRIHLRTLTALCLVIVAAEVVISLVLKQNNAMISTSLDRYFLRFVYIPAAVYAVIVGFAQLVYRFSHLDGKTLNYVISLSFVAVCVAVCFFHDYFVVVYASGVAAISMTTIYGDQRLTGVTTLTILLADILLILLNSWDPSVVRDEAYLIDISLVLLIELSTYLVSIMIVEWEYKRRHAVVLRQVEIENLRWTAVRDQLTGIRNRLGLRQHIDQQPGMPTYAMMDIDHFKSVNDRWGHAMGDQVLQGLGSILQGRESGSLAAFRYGGDEFLLSFSNCGEAEIAAACEEIRAAFLASLPADIRDAGVDLSYGISPFRQPLEPSEAIRQADEALYRDKRSADE